MLPKTLADKKQVLMDRPEEAAYFPCSFDDPRVKETMRRLKEQADWMARMGVPRLVDRGAKFTTSAQTNVGQTFDRIRRIQTGVARRVK